MTFATAATHAATTATLKRQETAQLPPRCLRNPTEVACLKSYLALQTGCTCMCVNHRCSSCGIADAAWKAGQAADAMEEFKCCSHYHTSTRA